MGADTYWASNLLTTQRRMSKGNIHPVALTHDSGVVQPSRYMWGLKRQFALGRSHNGIFEGSKLSTVMLGVVPIVFQMKRNEHHDQCRPGKCFAEPRLPFLSQLNHSAVAVSRLTYEYKKLANPFKLR
jgi:hypothetical protein